MKLEIELDLNKIDYDTINKQVQEKIAEMDLQKVYSIDNKIETKVNEGVDEIITDYMRTGKWGSLNMENRMAINDEIHAKIHELVQPYIEEIFNKIPEEELMKIISDMIPKVLMDILITKLELAIQNSYVNSTHTTLQMCEERIRNILHI